MIQLLTEKSSFEFSTNVVFAQLLKIASAREIDSDKCGENSLLKGKKTLRNLVCICMYKFLKEDEIHTGYRNFRNIY